MITNKILLTTYPHHKSRNIGDNLITRSFIKLILNIDKNFNPVIHFREHSLIGYSKKNKQIIYAPGFSIVNDTYPMHYKLFPSLDRLKYFFPIGCSFQHQIPSMKSFLDYKYNQHTLDFLNYISQINGEIGCRDQLIVDLLKRNNIPAFYSGDMAIYDEKFINKEFNSPKEIKSLVVSIGHHQIYYEQLLELLKFLQKKYKNAKLFISLHSRPNNLNLSLANTAIQLGFNILNLSGDISNLELYENIDIHIGYRLHGHIYFLSQRKPSILLIEDARSYGLSRTNGTKTGCIDAFDEKQNLTNKTAVNQVKDLLEKSEFMRFKNYDKIFNFIDRSYSNLSNYLNKKITELA